MIIISCFFVVDTREMESGRKRYSRTGAGVPVSLGDGGDKHKRCWKGSMLEPRLLQARAHARGSARASAQVHLGRSASPGTSGRGASHCVDARLRWYHGRTLLRIFILVYLFIFCNSLNISWQFVCSINTCISTYYHFVKCLVQLENITRLFMQDIYAKNIIICGKEILLFFEKTNLCMHININYSSNLYIFFLSPPE